IDGVLAWYLREVPVRWVASAGESFDDAPRLVLVSTSTSREAVVEPSGVPRYTIAATRDTIRQVELR
ncbi:MAG TPA: hypothetical protein VHR17_04055, partial [Thermoanaerobaculia bacterium]|nr:hypothetical protein [Thermoanaerobaculia bacterium]